MAKRKSDKPRKQREPKAAKPTVEAISEDQQQALFIRAKRALAPLYARKAQVDADIKQALAIAKADGISKEMLDYARKIETDAGEAAAIAKRAAENKVNLWLGVPIGGQAEMFDNPPPNKHFVEGKAAGAAGDPRRPPAHIHAIADVDQWFAGYDVGVKAYNAIESVGRGADAKADFISTIG